MTDILYTKETISKAVHTKWAGKTVHFARTEGDFPSLSPIIP